MLSVKGPFIVCRDTRLVLCKNGIHFPTLLSIQSSLFLSMSLLFSNGPIIPEMALLCCSVITIFCWFFTTWTAFCFWCLKVSMIFRRYGNETASCNNKLIKHRSSSRSKSISRERKGVKTHKTLSNRFRQKQTSYVVTIVSSITNPSSAVVDDEYRFSIISAQSVFVLRTSASLFMV